MMMRASFPFVVCFVFRRYQLLLCRLSGVLDLVNATHTHRNALLLVAIATLHLRAGGKKDEYPTQYVHALGIVWIIIFEVLTV